MVLADAGADGDNRGEIDAGVIGMKPLMVMTVAAEVIMKVMLIMMLLMMMLMMMLLLMMMMLVMVMVIMIMITNMIKIMVRKTAVMIFTLEVGMAVVWQSDLLLPVSVVS